MGTMAEMYPERDNSFGQIRLERERGFYSEGTALVGSLRHRTLGYT